MPEEFHSNSHYNLSVFISAIIWTVVIYFILSGSATIFEVDSYYHIRLADIMAKYGLILPSEFPWTACAIWNNAFFDKEWLFHVILIPLIKLGGELVGCKIFILTSVFLCAIAWGSLLKVLRIKYPFFVLLLIIFASGPAFASRLLMCRPHLLSIMLFAIFLICLVKNKRVLIFCVSYIYALSYTGCWQIVPIAILYDLITLWHSKERKGWKNWLSIYTFSGITAGMIINPYFPFNISGLYIQNIMILKAAILGGTLYRLDLGMELYPPALIKIFTNYLLLFILNATAFISLLENRKTVRDFQLKLFFGCLSLTYMILTILVVKFTDYFVPLAVVFLILYFQDKITAWNKRFFLLIVIAILLISFGIFSALALKKEIYQKNIRYYDSANWINQTVELQRDIMHPQKLIFTSSWDDPPYLFYSLPNFKYLVFLDPYFMYSHSPDKYRMWQKIAEGKTNNPALLIQQEFGTNIVFVNSRHKALQIQLEESECAKLKFEGKNGEKVFILK